MTTRSHFENCNPHVSITGGKPFTEGNFQGRPDSARDGKGETDEAGVGNQETVTSLPTTNASSISPFPSTLIPAIPTNLVLSPFHLVSYTAHTSTFRRLSSVDISISFAFTVPTFQTSNFV